MEKKRLETILVYAYERHVVKLMQLNYEHQGRTVLATTSVGEAQDALEVQTFDAVAIHFEPEPELALRVLAAVRESETSSRAFVMGLGKREAKALVKASGYRVQIWIGDVDLSPFGGGGFPPSRPDPVRI